MDPFSIVTSGISTLSNLFGNVASQQNADNANRLSVQMQRENNQFNHDEAELAYQRQVEQWQRETGYNSPIEQVKRLQQAGLNPALLYGGNGPTNVAASSHPGSQASSASSGISPQLPNLMPVFSGREFSDIAKGLVEAKKTGLDVKEAAATLQSRIEAWKADAEMKATAAHLQSVYGEALQQQQLAEGFERVTLLAEQAKNAAKEGLNIEADTYLKKMEAQLSDMQKQVKEKERDNWKLKNDVFMDDFRASLGLKKAQTNEANATASRNNAEAQTINALRVDEVRLKRAEADYQSYNAGIALHNLQNQPLVKAKLVRELLSLTEDITQKRLSNEQETILTARYGELIDQDIQKGEKQLRQMGQDYWNPFRYIGTLLGGGVASGMGKELIKPK